MERGGSIKFDLEQQKAIIEQLEASKAKNQQALKDEELARSLSY